MNEIIVKHTPGPYQVERTRHALLITSPRCKGKIWAVANIRAAHPSSVAKEAERVANAEFIVRACNSHDELLAECEAALNMAANLGAHADSPWCVGLHAAIAKARGEA